MLDSTGSLKANRSITAKHMVVYRHDKRAGNFGDVHKHIVLLSALSAATASADAASSDEKVLYIETHAASGSYESTSSKAEDMGIGRVLAAAETQAIKSPDIQAYANTIQRYRNGAAKSSNRYPGSPLLALSCLQPGRDEAVYAEHQQEVANELSGVLRAYKEDNNKSVHTSVEVGDGYAALRKKLAGLANNDEPAGSTVPFVLIDPPFTDLRSELNDIPTATRKCLDASLASIVLVWYPIKQGCDHALRSWKEDMASVVRGKPHRLLFGEIWTSSRTNKSSMAKEGALVGSGMALIHPHGHVADTFMPLTKELYDVLASDTESGSWSVLEC